MARIKDFFMAKMNESGKRKKRWATGLSLSMAAVLSLGIFAACKTTDGEEEPEEEESAAMPADTQLLKNGDFEFYSEMTKDEDELRAILNTPTSWSFSSGSPSSDTKSGLVDLKYWDSITKSKHAFTDINDAYANWKEGSIYDKLNFFYKCDNPSNNTEYDPFEDAYDALAADSAEKKFFDEQAFSSVDFEDVQYLREELGESVALHGDTDAEKSDKRGVLMIHNRRTSDGAVGTAQSYSSSTTITLQAGTSAEISVWVKTANLRHYYADLKGENDTLDGLEVTADAGAYIGVTQTVGGTTLDQMQIKNINTKNTETNNGWEKYTVYVRASTFATTTVKLVLGLGQGSSDDRYEAVNGYALFDDVNCKIIGNDEYTTKTTGLAENYKCDINDKKAGKLFDATRLSKNNEDNAVFAIDLYAGDFADKDYTDGIEIGLTKEKPGMKEYTSANIDKSLYDNSDDESVPENKRSIADVLSYNDIVGSNNGYLKNIAKNDFENYPDSFGKDNIILLLSTNGAAYTATTKPIKLDGNSRLLISFFVKTSEVISGRTGASVTLVDGSNKTTISAFDSTTVSTVDITNPNDEASSRKNIYDGWVQCFFFVSNDTDDEKSFTLEFSLGPTSIASSSKYDYGQGYAAFANFQTKDLTKTELSYASTGERAKKVTLTGSTEDTTVFDEASKVWDIEERLANPQNFEGVLAGSKRLVAPTEGNTVPDNDVPEGLLTGLLNYKHAVNYTTKYDNVEGKNLFEKFTEKTGDAAWKELFGDSDGKTALQPLVIMNPTESALPSYGYFASNATVSANSYQKISLRVKLSKGAKATVYLTDVSEFSTAGYNAFLAPNAPKVTYWYDENGNICKSDPTVKGFKKNEGIVFELQTNGLYRKADDANDTNYYANLKNYNEKNGNLVTNSDAIAFYGNDGKFYAYRTENADGTYSYSTEVKDLYENGGKAITRYDYTDTEFPGSVVEVTNSDEEENPDWVTVAFYVHTGSEAKTYRLEVWAGDRENATDGIPAGGYVFFDRYSSSTISNYDTLLEEAVDNLKAATDTEINENLSKDYAYYYTFTYYDSVNYLRYDVNEDADEAGNPYASYDQSAYSEQLISLKYDDLSGESVAPSKIRFLNYAASDVTVEPDNLGGADEEPAEDDGDNEISTGDILLIISSALLGVVLVFVIVLLLVRRFTDKRRRATRAATTVEDKRYKPSRKKEAANAEEEEENPFVKNRKAKEAAETAKAEEPEAPAEEPAEEPATEESPAEEPTEEAPVESDDKSEE